MYDYKDSSDLFGHSIPENELMDSLQFRNDTSTDYDFSLQNGWQDMYGLDPSGFLNFNNNSNNNDLQENVGLDMLDEQQQQAILLSDPSFKMQQQLLQSQQEKAQKMEEDDPTSTTNQSNSLLSSSLPSSSMMYSINSNNNNININNQAIMPSQKKEPIRRRSLLGGKNISKPIPISSTKHTSSSSSPLEVDHQRRFNELQARFRVNYAKKPQKTSGSLKSNDLLGSSMPGSTFNEHGSYPSMSSSYTDGVPSTHRRKLSLDQSANSKLLGVRKEGSKIKASTGGGGGNISKASGTAAIPIKSEAGGNSGSGTTQQSSSLPSRTMPIAIQRVHRGGPFQPFDSEQRQKRLDDQLVKVDFDDITVSELKEMLRQRGKPATGKKAILLQRLQEEREIIKAAKNGGRPISLQQQPLNEESGSSPMMMAASMPNNSSSMLLSSSPGTSLLSLNRSIQDMHIGSPPSQPSRRFSPYATSPRSNPVPLSPQSSFSSSSVPTGGTLDANIRLMRRPQPQQGWSNSRQKLYAPFTSSALATPDREDDYNPFDDLDGRMQNEFESPNQAPMEWTDPSLELLLQQGNDLSNKMTQEELLALLSEQGLFEGNDFMMNNAPPDLTTVMYDNNEGSSSFNSQNFSNYSNSNNNSGYNF